MIAGSMVALVTPMDAQGRLDWDSLGKLVDFHLQEGTNAIVAVGTAATAVYPEDVDFNPQLPASGLIVSTLAAGTKLYIYHDGPNPLKTT